MSRGDRRSSRREPNDPPAAGVRLYSAFFATPAELLATLRDRLRRLRQTPKSEAPRAAPPAPRLHAAEGTDTDTAHALAAARVLSASAARTVAACAEARAAGRALWAQCSELRVWAGPLLSPRGGARCSRHKRS